MGTATKLKAVRPILQALVITAAAGICAAAGEATSETAETLFLRDGSVVKGVVIPGPGATILVDGPYGCLTVEPKDIEFRMEALTTAPVLSESFILVPSSFGAIATTSQSVPEPQPEMTTFSLLVSGRVLAVKDTVELPMPFQAEPAGAATRVILKYRDLPRNSRSVRVTALVEDMLENTGERGVRFQQTYTPDRDGRARVAVRYPEEWTLRSISPEPSTKASGLVVWDLELRRQATFAPMAEFER